MRYFAACILLSLTLIFTACGGGKIVEHKLDYQNHSLYIEGEFTIDDDTIYCVLTLDAPEYDDEGRMLTRGAKLTIGENSIISGVTFEFVGGEAFVGSGVLKIPIEDESVISGISDIISLFCIDESCYYLSEDVTDDGIDCRVDTYVNGDSKVEVIIDTACQLPKAIRAALGERELSVDIKLIKAE